jgi:predicted ATPase
VSFDNLKKKLTNNFASRKYDKFIHDVTFPKFKNFAPDSRIEFNYPITAIVGPNGGGKSTVLQALWGMPQGFSTSRFWFSTPVDPINQSPKDQHRYWYSHFVKAIDRCVQSRKMQGNKRNGYWEPTRPNVGEGMEKMPASDAQNSKFMSGTGDRWNQVERTPIYINSKAGFSAFERFFYYSEIDKLEERQNYFLKYSNQLRVAIDNDLDNLDYYSIRRVFKNFFIKADSLEVINKILGKSYKSARYIVHDLYGKVKSPSVIFETAKQNYSESFAGSGELAVVNTVLELDRLKDYDLLLDEPETSLHPGAQKKLLEYLVYICDKKKVQIVLSTHSPTFIEHLPKEALVVLDDSDLGVIVRKSPNKTGAFQRLGHPPQGKVLLLAEDSLMAAFVEVAVSKLENHMRSIVEVKPATVGASEMLSNQVKAYATSSSKVLMILDGDQRPVQDIFQVDPSSISPTRKAELIAQLGKLNVGLVGGDQFFDHWMSCCRNHVVVIDEVCAEQVLLMCLSDSYAVDNHSTKSNQEFKNAVRKRMLDLGLSRNADGQAQALKLELKRHASLDSPQVNALNALTEKLREKLQLFLA